MKGNVPDEVIVTDSVRSNTQSVFDKWNGVPSADVERMFNFRPVGGNKKLTLRQYLNNSKEYDDGLNYYQCKAVRRNIVEGLEDLHPGRIKMGTIHSSKGKEAETVILATDTTQTIVENMETELLYDEDKYMTDGERRVYYVGMSRASEKLVLCEGLAGEDMNIPIQTLLEGKSDGEQTKIEQYE
jgi:hypothetical protein